MKATKTKIINKQNIFQVWDWRGQPQGPLRNRCQHPRSGPDRGEDRQWRYLHRHQTEHGKKDTDSWEKPQPAQPKTKGTDGGTTSLKGREKLKRCRKPKETSRRSSDRWWRRKQLETRSILPPRMRQQGLRKQQQQQNQQRKQNKRTETQRE